MCKLDPQTVNMFHFTGRKHTTPNCPVDMAPDFNPSSGTQSYRPSTSDCTRSSYYNIPFFLDRPGPKYEEWSVNAHEARPGHHTQVNENGIIPLQVACPLSRRGLGRTGGFGDTILFPIALFASLSRQGLGTRNEGLWRQRISSPRF